MRSILFILLIEIAYLFLNNCQADEIRPFGARQLAMGGCSVGFIDSRSVIYNQGAMAFSLDGAVGASFHNRFLVENLSTQSAYGTLPVGKGVFGVNVNHFGYALYQEFNAGLAYGRRFGDYLGAGLKLNYQHYALGDNYGSTGVVTFDFGLFAKITDDLSLGVALSNPLRPELTPENKTEAYYLLGASYQFGDNVMASAEVEKRSDLDPSIRVGLEYWFVDKLCFRAGIDTNPVSYSFGFGFKIKDLQLNIASQVSNSLGVSPAVGFSYQF